MTSVAWCAMKMKAYQPSFSPFYFHLTLFCKDVGNGAIPQKSFLYHTLPFCTSFRPCWVLSCPKKSFLFLSVSYLKFSLGLFPFFFLSPLVWPWTLKLGLPPLCRCLHMEPKHRLVLECILCLAREWRMFYVYPCRLWHVLKFWCQLQTQSSCFK